MGDYQGNMHMQKMLLRLQLELFDIHNLNSLQEVAEVDLQQVELKSGGIGPSVNTI
jgi:hypothetical protein